MAKAAAVPGRPRTRAPKEPDVTVEDLELASIQEGFDFKNPNYNAVFQRRLEMLHMIRTNPKLLPNLKAYYRDNPAQFICDWGITVDPKNVEKRLPAAIPFILFPKQIEFVEEVVKHWKTQTPMLAEKTRQMGFSWLLVAISCTLCLFNEGMAIGIGSRKEEYVDKIGDPKSLLHKARVFLQNLPPEFRGGWDQAKHAPHMRIIFPGSNASISGEAGDGIGRGNTTGIYFVDEAAFLERPHLIEASLSQTTNCRIDISTPNGMANPFAERRHGGKVDVFTMRWTDDPRKDQAWYEKQQRELDPVTLAQEVDIDYAASVEGVVIPAMWVRAAVDACLKLKITPTGERLGALDVADEGKDGNAFCARHGVEIQMVEEWSGKGSDIYKTTERAFGFCDTHNLKKFKYDSDGLGAGVRGDARIINLSRQVKIECLPFRGSEGVFNPEKEDVKGRKNKDYFLNCKAQSWWMLRRRFEKTYGWVVEGRECHPDEIISIPSTLRNFTKLLSELSQATYATTGVGKLVIDKAPDSTKSPNLADSVVIAYSTSSRPSMRINASIFARI